MNLTALVEPGGELEVEGRRLTLSSLDKVLWPATGFTKGELLDYYARVAPALLPHLAGRALTLGRFPDGVEGRGFAQVECRGRPAWLRTRALRLRDATLRRYCVVGDLPSLLWVANLDTIELHPFLFRGTRASGPDAVVFDVDPGPGAGFAECCETGLRLREVLAAQGLAVFAKSSGSRGLHLYLPLGRPHGWQAAKRFARATAERLAAERPGAVTAAPTRASRVGKVFVDWLQNDPRRSTIAPYSLRATDRPAASTPLSWEEVEWSRSERDERLLDLAPAEVIARVERHADLFRPVLDLQQSLPRQPLSDC